MNLTVRHPRDVRLLQELMKKIRNVDIVLAVTASWCGPCQRLKPVLERVSKTPNQTVPLINVDESVFNKTPFANKVNVSQYPTIVKVGKNGNVTPIERKETLEEDEANLKNIVTAPKSSTAQTFSNRNSLPRASMNLNSQIKPTSQSPFENRSSVTLSPPDSTVSQTPGTSLKRTTSVQSISNGMPTPTTAPNVDEDIVKSQARAKVMTGGRMLRAIKKLAKSLTRKLTGKTQHGGEYGLSKTVDAINALGEPEKKRLADYMDKEVPNHGKVTLPSEVASRYKQICPAMFEKHEKCPAIKKYVEAGCPAEYNGKTYTSNNRALVGGK